jgi:hypothetical protein
MISMAASRRFLPFPIDRYQLTAEVGDSRKERSIALMSVRQSGRSTVHSGSHGIDTASGAT